MLKKRFLVQVIFNECYAFSINKKSIIFASYIQKLYNNHKVKTGQTVLVNHLIRGGFAYDM